MAIDDLQEVGNVDSPNDLENLELAAKELDVALGKMEKFTCRVDDDHGGEISDSSDGPDGPRGGTTYKAIFNHS
jgi:hypothetical protein